MRAEDCGTPGGASRVGDRTVVDPEMHLPYDYAHSNRAAGYEPGGDRLRTERVRLRRGVADGRA